MNIINLSDELIKINKSLLQKLIENLRELFKYMKKDFPIKKDFPVGGKDYLRNVGYGELARKYLLDLDELESSAQPDREI